MADERVRQTVQFPSDVVAVVAHTLDRMLTSVAVRPTSSVPWQLVESLSFAVVVARCAKHRKPKAKGSPSFLPNESVGDRGQWTKRQMRQWATIVHK